MPDASIHTQATVISRLSPAYYSVELPNGKQIGAHLSKSLADGSAQYEAGDALLLEISPFDFETARILGCAE
ncbi:MAG: translation initiation factor IF-1 [Luteolibacter sp.]